MEGVWNLFGRIMIRKKIFFISLVFILIASINGCATFYNPATGRNELIFISEEQEVEIGKGVANEVEKKYKLLDDQVKQDYLQGIGSRIAAVCDRPNLDYYFKIIDDETINAFAAPGGFIYMHKGLMDKLDEDEIAFVLGHEISHITARHSVKRIQANLGYQLILALAFIGAGKGNENTVQAVADISNTVFNLVVLGYSREDEYFADMLGVEYSKKAGFNPNGAVGALEKLRNDKQTWHIYVLSTHPPLDERINRVKEHISKLE